MFFVTSTKSSLTIHSLFLQEKRKGNPLEKLLFFVKKKLKRLKWETPKKETLAPI